MGDGTTARNVIFAIITLVILLIIISSQLPILPKIAKSVLGFDPFENFYNSTDDRKVTPVSNLENLKIKQKQILIPFIEDLKACKLSKDVDCFCDMRDLKLTEEEFIQMQQVGSGTEISIYEGRVDTAIGDIEIKDIITHQRKKLISEIIQNNQFFVDISWNGAVVASQGFQPNILHFKDPLLLLINEGSNLLVYRSIETTNQKYFLFKSFYKINSNSILFDNGFSEGKFREEYLDSKSIKTCDPKRTEGSEGKPAPIPEKEKTPLDLLLEDTKSPEKEARSKEALGKLARDLEVLSLQQ